jgi:hypothetical protein
MPETEDSLLLLRVRSAANKTSSDMLDLEVEAQLNYRSIYLAGKTQLDMKQLKSALNAAGNSYGHILGESLGNNCAVKNALRDADRRGRLRIQLMTQDCDNLPLIYWERMELPGWLGPAGTENQTPFSRFAAVNQGLEDAPQDKVFRLLLVVANPEDGLEPIDVAEHCATVVECCSDLLNSGLMTIAILPGFQGLSSDERKRVASRGVQIIDKKPSTAENINELLDAKPHALHLIAHGTYNPQKGFYLLLESDDGHLEAFNASDLIEIWNPEQLQLVFLESCQSAVNEDIDPRPHMHGFMQQFVSAGLAGVVAMQDKIRMEDARTFAKGFYTNLLRSGSLDEAANAARRLLLHTPDYAWAIPAVMTRLKGGAVWRESGLRSAQRGLQAQIQARHDQQSYPRFPLDAIAVSSDGLLKRAADRKNDEVVKVPLGQNVVRDLYLGLYEALLQDHKNICILGPYGTAKTRVLEDVFLSEFQNHIEEQQKALPVLLRLSDCAHGVADPQTVVAKAIRNYFGEVSGPPINLDDLIDLFHNETFLFLIAANDHLGETEQQSGLQLLKQFQEHLDSRSDSKPHRYLFTLDQNLVRVADLPESAHCLFVQLMSAERVSRYLRAPNDTASSEARQRVLDKLRASALFDLAESPWLFAEMLNQAQRGLLKKENTGRAAILSRVCDERIAQFAGPSGMRARVEDVLYRMAWEVQRRQTPTLSGSDVFEVLAELRGNRDYSLMEFRSQLVDSCRIMSSCGEDGMRFAYPAFQAYCCARYILRQSDKERDRLLTDITATLGRRSRVEWWSETLYLIAGLWPNTSKLLSMILSGSPLHEGDQIFIAARCLHEARLSSEQPIASNPTIVSMISALKYRSHPANSVSIDSRIRATNYLGPLREDSAVKHLVSIVLDKLRPTREGPDYELSGGRLAAIKALLYNQEETVRHLHEDQPWRDNKALVQTVDNWVALDSNRLKQDLNSDDELCASVAAFALGLLKPISALSAMKERFFQNPHQTQLLWALADAMLELGNQDLHEVVNQCLQPGRKDWCIFGAYFIGKLGRSYTGRLPAKEWDERRAFLWTSALESNSGQVHLKGQCLLTLAQLHEPDLLDVCHQWIRGDDGTLRYHALQAIRYIGDENSLCVLESLDFPLADSSDNRLLDRLRLEVYEDLYWRLAGGLAREVMIPVSPKQEQPVTTKHATAAGQ